MKLRRDLAIRAQVVNEHWLPEGCELTAEQMIERGPRASAEAILRVSRTSKEKLRTILEALFKVDDSELTSARIERALERAHFKTCIEPDLSQGYHPHETEPEDPYADITFSD